MERLSFRHRHRPPGYDAFAIDRSITLVGGRMLRIVVGLVGAALMCICAAAADGGLRTGTRSAWQWL